MRQHARLLVALAAGCSTYTTTHYTSPQHKAATLDDTAPPEAQHDPALDYETAYGLSNHSARRFRFDVAAYRDDLEKSEAARLHPSHAAHLRTNRGIPSVQTISTYAKQLDDTIVAGVELAVQAGLEPTLAAKRTVIADALAHLLANRTREADEAIVLLAAAARATGGAPQLPAEVAAQVKQLELAFDRDTAAGKPIGFYTWSDDLRALWRQDRLLQRPLANGSACALAQAIAADPARERSYRALVDVQARMTNPSKATLVGLLASPCAPGPDRHAFLAGSRSLEESLFARLYPHGVPPKADLMRDLIAAIRDGLDLAPQPDDGWYQHGMYALETLLVTDKAQERAKVAFTARYKKRLEEAFSTMLTQKRETHIKSFGGKKSAAYAVSPVPQFALEPLATVYVRHARSYLFLEAALEQILGAGALDRASAIGARGPDGETLRARIRRARDLYYGAYLVACQELGMHPALDAAGDPAPEERAPLVAAARTWLTNLPSDPIAAADVRVAIPIAAVSETRAKYWVVVGVRTTMAGYSFLDDGDVARTPAPDKLARVSLPTEQFLEVESSITPLTRDELRALCDKHVTLAAIQRAIEARR